MLLIIINNTIIIMDICEKLWLTQLFRVSVSYNTHIWYVIFVIWRTTNANCIYMLDLHWASYHFIQMCMCQNDGYLWKILNTDQSFLLFQCSCLQLCNII